MTNILWIVPVVAVVLALTLTNAVGAQSRPDNALIIRATDHRYTEALPYSVQPDAQEPTYGPWHGWWNPYPLPGYAFNSSFTIAHAPVVKEVALEDPLVLEDAAPLRTAVTDLEPGRHYVYLRYDGAIQARLVGVQSDLVRYDAANSDWQYTMCADPLSKVTAYEVYLGCVAGHEVEVMIDDVVELKTHSIYDGLVIRTPQQEAARAEQLRADITALLDRVRQQLDLAGHALANPAIQRDAFKSRRTQFQQLVAQAAEAEQLIASADDPQSLNHARRVVSTVAHGLFVQDDWGMLSGLLTGRELAADDMRAWASALSEPMDSDNDGIVTFPCSTMTVAMPPTYVPLPSEANRPLHTFACRGQYQPLSFAVLPLRDVQGLRVGAGSLHGADQELPASAIDVKAVVGWWAPIYHFWEADHLPLGIRAQILANDPRLVSFELDRAENHFPDGEYLRDAAILRPVDLPAGRLQQYWLTIHIPEDQPAGLYEGHVNIRAGSELRARIPISVEVMPFDLPEPMLDYGFYYNAELSNSDAAAWRSGSARSRRQILTELQDMRAHGIKYPAFSCAPERLREMLGLMKEADMATDRLFWHSFPNSPQKVARAVRIAEEEGFGEVYFYLHDEAGDQTRLDEIRVCRMVHANGGKTFVADNHGNALRILRQHLDLPNLAAGTLGSGVNDYYHSLGRKVYTYMRPNTEGLPESLRRVYGLALWQMGYDGGMPWTWTRSPWCFSQGYEWDRKRWVYMQWRTPRGFISTIKSEAWRAAIDDVRYLTALLQVTAAAQAAGHDSEADEARAHVEQLRHTLPGSFHQIRGQIAQHTARLDALIQETTSK